MKFLFKNETVLYKIKLVSDTWMCLICGEGEKEIASQGRLTVNGFSQETEAITQMQPWNGEDELKLRTKSQVQDAHDSLTQLPFFSFSIV